MLAEVLKRIREEHQLTQKDVAKLLGVSERMYQKYEAGRNRPNIERLKKLAQHFNVTLDTLLND